MTSYMPANAMYEFADGEVAGGAVFREREGHSCCGGCCDMRRAVIIVNGAMILFLILGEFFMAAAYDIAYDTDNITDDEDAMANAKAMQKVHFGWIIFFHVIQIICYGTGLWGALKFDRKLVMVALVCYLLSFVFNLVTFQIVAVLLNGFFAYPHYFLQKEIEANIMTPDNYPNEVQSCCCVTPK
jgi:hypothetical protein